MNFGRYAPVKGYFFPCKKDLPVRFRRWVAPVTLPFALFGIVFLALIDTLQVRDTSLEEPDVAGSSPAPRTQVHLNQSGFGFGGSSVGRAPLQSPLSLIGIDHFGF